MQCVLNRIYATASREQYSILKLKPLGNATEASLTLGAHAPEGYGSCPVCVSVCVCVCVCVCVSVRNLNLGTGASRGLNEGTSE